MIEYDSKGREIPDRTPMELPVGFKRPEPLADLIKRLISSDLAAQAANDAGLETFDEADDFDTGESFDPNSPWEENFDPLHSMTREREIAGGIVKDRSLEEKENARELVRRLRKTGSGGTKQEDRGHGESVAASEGSSSSVAG